MLKLAMVKGEVISIGEDVRIRLASDTVKRANILIDAPSGLFIKREASGEEEHDVKKENEKKLEKTVKKVKKNIIIVTAKKKES